MTTGMTAQDNHCMYLHLGLLDGLRDAIIKSLPSLEQTKSTDPQRGGHVWTYADTKEIIKLSQTLLDKRPVINDMIQNRGLELSAIEKTPKIVHTGENHQNGQFVGQGYVAVVTPMTDTKVPLRLYGQGEVATNGRAIEAVGDGSYIILGETMFHLPVPYHLMAVPVRKR